MLGVYIGITGFFRDKYSLAQAIAVTELGLDPEVVRRAWPKHDWSAVLTDSILQDMQEKADFLADADKTRTRINVRKDYVDTRFFAAD